MGIVGLIVVIGIIVYFATRHDRKRRKELKQLKRDEHLADERERQEYESHKKKEQ